jgi:tetratricopeptide (TPR) repeat protein
MKALDETVHALVASLSAQGDMLVNACDFAEGLRKYHEAWKLLPEPKEDWEAATWLLAAIGEAHFYAGDFEHAISALNNAVICPDGLGNPFIHLRLGQSYFELRKFAKAQDELTRAYMGGGKEIFDNEDPKYFEHLKSVLET